MSDKKVLNRGLDALLGSAQGAPQRSIKDIQISKISPGRFQPRQDFNAEKIAELSSSIKKHGILSPILVREIGLNSFEVIAGERRLRASKMAGLNEIPCLVDQQEDVAGATGKARSTIANSLRLLTLPTSVLNLLSQGSLEKGHAKLLVSLDSEKASNLAKQIISSNLTVREAQNLTSKKPNKNNPKSKSKDLLNIEQEMSEGFGHKIEIDAKNKKTGKVLIHYSTAEELENIIGKLV